ncbi:MAG TPA: hypothetical protein PKD61_08625 [Polyangiaceae bacterium]|nr:hypothetical protein [Polyangiaceae bacterium]
MTSDDSTLGADEIHAALAAKLAREQGCVAEVDTMPGDVLSEWALFAGVAVELRSDGAFEVRFIEGPGFVAAKRDIHEVANEFVASEWARQPSWEGARYELRIDPAEGFAEEWIAIIEEEANKFIAEVDGYMGLACGDKSDPARDAIVDGAIATLTGPKSLEIAFFRGPAFERGGDGESAAALFAHVPARAKARLPQLADWTIELVWDE